MPRPAHDEALIRVRRAGICGTDLEITRGYKGFHGVLGHEFTGEVVACEGPDWIGRRVCGEINVACGVCHLCAKGFPTHCERREVLGILGRAGVFAEFLVLPLRNLHRVPDSVSDDMAVFTEPLAAAFEVLEQVPIAATDRVVILGDGKLGLLCAQVVKGTGADVLLIGKHDDKLRLASDFGIPNAPSSFSDPGRADVVIEATGSPDGFQRAIELVEPRGVIVLKSTVSSRLQADLSALVVKEITVVGSRCGPFPPALQALAEGAVQVLPLIRERYPLADAVQAMERAAEPGMLKVLIDMTAN